MVWWCEAESPLPALPLRSVECLREALERILVGRLHAAARGAFDREVGTLAHGLDYARFVGGILYPGAAILGVHRELGGADLSSRMITESSFLTFSAGRVATKM